MLLKLLSKMLYINFETDSHFFPNIYIFGEISLFYYYAKKAERHFDFAALGEQWVNIKYVHVIV
jgi:hypothetical protein